MKIFAALEDIVAFCKSPRSYEEVAEQFQVPGITAIKDLVEYKKNQDAQVAELKGRLALLVKRGELECSNGKYSVKVAPEPVYEPDPYFADTEPFDPEPEA